MTTLLGSLGLLVLVVVPLVGWVFYEDRRRRVRWKQGGEIDA